MMISLTGGVPELNTHGLVLYHYRLDLEVHSDGGSVAGPNLPRAEPEGQVGTCRVM